MNGQSPIIGIDLGTTFSAMAFINEEGVPEIICNRDLTANQMLDADFTVFVRNANLQPEIVEQKRLAFTKVTVN